MPTKFLALLMLMSIAFALGCQDASMVVYDPNPRGEGDAAADEQTATPTNPTDFNPQPQGPIPFTQNPIGLSPSGLGSMSNGTGGQTGLQEITFAQGRFKINAPSDIGPNKAYGLHVHLHGDGGGGYTSFPNRQLANNLIGVAVRAPMAGSPQWGRSRGAAHAAYLDDLIHNEILRKYNIRTDQIYFSGVSGGAYFLTGHFVPMFAQKYRSGALILCGGMAPAVSFQDSSALRNMRIHFIVTSGERRDITANIDQSLNAYRPLYGQAGAANMLSNETVGSGGHCEFDNRAYTSGIQLMIESKFSTVVKN